MLVPEYYVGQAYERLKIKKFVRRENDRYYYECECECGNTKVIDLYSLRKGLVKSCGCLQKEKAREHLRKSIVDGVNTFGLNRGIQSNNSTGVKGVCYETSKSKFRAYIGVKGKQLKLGSFDTLEEATHARLIAEEKYHKPIKEKLKSKDK